MFIKIPKLILNVLSAAALSPAQDSRELQLVKR